MEKVKLSQQSAQKYRNGRMDRWISWELGRMEMRWMLDYKGGC
jgi:hypothetical protein